MEHIETDGRDWNNGGFNSAFVLKDPILDELTTREVIAFTFEEDSAHYAGMMEAAANLAGFFGAHAVWNVSEGAILIPLIGIETVEGVRRVHRFSEDRIEDGVKKAQEFFALNPERAARAVLIFDGYLTLSAAGKVDALIVEAHDYELGHSMRVGLPYRPASSAEGFAVHRPKFIGFTGFEPDFESIGAAFFEGVEGHEKAAPIWAEHLDESV